MFGLSIHSTKERIRETFEHYGEITRINQVIDAKTKKSRGFCFIYYKNSRDAKQAKENCDGMVIDDKKVRVDYSNTSRPHDKTPGYYLGKRTSELRQRKTETEYYTRLDRYGNPIGYIEETVIRGLPSAPRERSNRDRNGYRQDDRQRVFDHEKRRRLSSPISPHHYRRSNRE